MDKCFKCKQPIGWDDRVCPKCGADNAHIDPELAEGRLWPEVRWRLIFFGGAGVCAFVWSLITSGC